MRKKSLTDYLRETAGNFSALINVSIAFHMRVTGACKVLYRYRKSETYATFHSLFRNSPESGFILLRV